MSLPDALFIWTSQKGLKCHLCKTEIDEGIELVMYENGQKMERILHPICTLGYVAICKDVARTLDNNVGVANYGMFLTTMDSLIEFVRMSLAFKGDMKSLSLFERMEANLNG